MGRVIVASWLAAHRGQVSERAWQHRRADWTPEVSARAWLRSLLERDALGDRSPDCYLVAEDDKGTLVAVAFGAVKKADERVVLAEVHALYVEPTQHRRGVGRLLLQQLAACLADRGATSVEIGVLTASDDARRFYEALGGQASGERLIEEDGEEVPESIYVWPDIANLLPPPGGTALLSGREDRPAASGASEHTDRSVGERSEPS